MSIESQISKQMVDVHHDKLLFYIEAMETNDKDLARYYCRWVVDLSIIYNKLKHIKNHGITNQRPFN